jgi:hypothetical protein
MPNVIKTNANAQPGRLEIRKPLRGLVGNTIFRMVGRNLLDTDTPDIAY